MSGHATTGIGQNIYYRSLSGTQEFLIGNVVYRVVLPTRDFAVVQVNAGVTTNKILTNPSPVSSISIRGFLKDDFALATGKLVRRYGAKSRVQSVNEIVGRYEILIQTKLYSGTISEGGDSGAPYWGQYDGNYFAGVHLGLLKTPTYNYMIFTPYFTVLSDVGNQFALKTN